MSSKQTELFPLEPHTKRVERIVYPTWCYITRRNDAEMLAGFSSDGTALWVEHDLQHTIPHVYSNARLANADKIKHKGQDVRYSRFVWIGGKRVNR
jgi:hypothetical protein